MSEVVAPLSDDEMTVLMIMNNTGDTLAAIGRWKKPIKSLTARGLVQMMDEVNYRITAAGIAAVEASQSQTMRNLIDANNEEYYRRQSMPQPQGKLP